MFGSALNFGFVPVAPSPRPPKDVPPPTPVVLPAYHPRVPEDADDDAPAARTPLTALLQRVIRPTELAERHFEALGVHVIPDASTHDIVPDMSVVPDFAAWDRLSYAQACDTNQSTRVRISNGNLSPGAQAYHDRIKELTTPNEAAFRAVRRVQPPPGQQQARLGNSYEFFRHLETYSTFWDDTSAPEPQPSAGEDKGPGGDETQTDTVKFYRTSAGSSMPPDTRINLTHAFVKLIAYDFGCNVTAPRVEPRLYLNMPCLPAAEEAPAPPPGSATTTSSSASETPSRPLAAGANSSAPPPPGRSSYFTSACTFVFRTPTTRDAARAGIVEGPLAAVSARHTTGFAPAGASDPSAAAKDKEALMDLAREIVAALLTAQHRAREGRAERRVGEGAWWATRPRWGGGEGGPIGREVDSNSATSTSTGTGNSSSGASSSIPVRTPAATSAAAAAAAAPTTTTAAAPASAAAPTPAGDGCTLPAPAAIAPALASSGLVALGSRTGSSFSASPGGRKSPHHHPVPSLSSRGPRSKSRRTTLAIYDNYRMVRPPSSSWDKKTRYSAIGRVPGADYDDVFVVSALFHHVSILRVRVPQKLLQVLDGAPESGRDEGGRGCGGGGGGETKSESDASSGKQRTGKRSWGKLEVFRSRWFDFFIPDDRVAAMKLIWAMMAYQMRKVEEEGDVKMVGT